MPSPATAGRAGPRRWWSGQGRGAHGSPGRDVHPTITESRRVPSDCRPDSLAGSTRHPGHAKVPAVAGTLDDDVSRDASGVGALAVVRALLLASAALASGLAHSRPPGVGARISVSKEAAVGRIGSGPPPSVIWIRTSRSWRRTRSRSDSGADSEQDRGDELLDRLLEVVALQAGAALAQVHLDDGAVGLVELVVDEVDDALDVVDAVVLPCSCSWVLTIALPSLRRAAGHGARPAAGRWPGRSRRACRAAGDGRGAAATSRCRWACP